MSEPETGPGEERPGETPAAPAAEPAPELAPAPGPAPPRPTPPRPAPIPTVSPAMLQLGRSLRELTPRGFVTEALVAVNVLVFAIMVARGVSPMEPKIDDLLAWGAGYGPRTTGGEPWRLFTATFLHIGVFHLAMNMYVLWGAGRLMERVFGNAGFLLLYVASGLAGSVASALWSPYVVSAGASGSVFGVYGGLLGFLVRERSGIPGEALQRLQRSGLLFVGLNVMIGLQVKGIDMAAHLGGLAGGFLAGLALAHPLDAAGASRRWLRNALLAAGTAVALALAVPAMPKRVDIQAELARIDPIEKRFNQAIENLKAQRIDDAQLVEEIEVRILPDYHAARQRLVDARGLPEAQAKRVTSLTRYMAAREEAFRLVAEAVRVEDPARVKQANEQQAEADRLLKELEK